MNKELEEILRQSEGRRLEFKSRLPQKSDLAKTVVAFANDAGGDILIGVNDDKSMAGLSDEELPYLEEQLCNIIYEQCYPAILPEITFLSYKKKNLIRVHIYRGSTPPYYLKSAGRVEGTYVRVGSTNRKADEEMIAELERTRRRVSYDGEIVYDKVASALDLSSFKQSYLDKTGEKLTPEILRKLDLVRVEQGVEYPTRALVLFSDDPLRLHLYPNARIDCARFKGIKADVFVDRKTIDTPLVQQAEDAYNFVIRHINQTATVDGVYTVSQWEYPIDAIREILRNAVVHRQYSREGMSIKLAIYDDMVEITSPGLLPPTIDYSAMTSRQSDARNKTIAAVFKKLGIIDQWGNGLTLVAHEMAKYPNIRFIWREVGNVFQVQFVRTELSSPASLLPMYADLPSVAQDIVRYLQSHPQSKRLDIEKALGKSTKTITKWINYLLKLQLIMSDSSPFSPNRLYRLKNSSD